MLAEVLKKFEFSYNYFTKTLEGGGKFPQSIIFEGLDIFGQLHFALELARELNPDPISEKWIKEGKHPAVMLISPINSKNGDTGSKTVISVKQSLGITKALEQTSDYHRVFILLDAKNQPLSEIDKKNLYQYAHLGYELEPDWLPCSLNQKIFQNTATNAILKAVEEPPARTTFIFLTNTRENLISTIISRSQIFKMPARKPYIPTDFIEEIFAGYPNITLEHAFDISAALQQSGEEPEILLTMMEEYIGARGSKAHLKKISQARKQLFASMSKKTVFDALLIGMAHG